MESRRVRISSCLARLQAGCLLVVLGCSSSRPSTQGEDAGDREAGGAAALKDVPRDRTIVVDCPDSGIGTGQYTDHDSFNPFVPGGAGRTGYNFLYEPLYFYNVYRDELIPWIAEGHEFNEDYTEVTITIRDGVEWSDGRPWTAADLAFTVNMLIDNAPFLLYSVDMKAHVERAEALDERTVRIRLTAPNPRFIFTQFTSSFCNGVPVVPKHVWEGRDPKTFRNLDIANGWPVVSGPYRMVASTPQQKVYDLRPGWWASETGFKNLPKPERLIYLTYMAEPQRVQNLIADELDTSLELRAANIKAVIDKNPRVSSWSGRGKPYGYLDHWPVCLGFNNTEEPFGDPEFRRAVSFAIDRAQLVEVGWKGAGDSTLVPFPEFPPMRRFVDAAGGLFEKYGHGVYDPSRTAEMMLAQGWSKDADGFWARDGERARIVIDGYVFIFQDVAPVLVEQLRRAGFDASYRSATDCYNRMSTGQAKSFLCGTSASIMDPYATLSHYHSRHVRPTGTGAPVFWRWRNAEFDTLVDCMAELPADDPEFMRVYLQAMDVWLRELPSIPIIAWHQRVPHNETRWKGWPSAENPYINGAYWHRTWLLVLLQLEPMR
jgi:peptide/nickel transport system substrate-binding protein